MGHVSERTLYYVDSLFSVIFYACSLFSLNLSHKTSPNKPSYKHNGGFEINYEIKYLAWDIKWRFYCRVIHA